MNSPLLGYLEPHYLHRPGRRCEDSWPVGRRLCHCYSERCHGDFPPGSIGDTTALFITVSTTVVANRNATSIVLRPPAFHQFAVNAVNIRPSDFHFPRLRSSRVVVQLVERNSVVNRNTGFAFGK